MTEIDTDRIEKLVGSMRSAMILLKESGAMPETLFLNDRHMQSSAKYNLVVSIEAVIDIANHVISRKKFRVPEDYADTFRVLAESRVIDADFAVELEKMARFRNRIVHLYWDVDVSEIWKILQTRLVDFERFVSEISAYLKR